METSSEALSKLDAEGLLRLYNRKLIPGSQLNKSGNPAYYYNEFTPETIVLPPLSLLNEKEKLDYPKNKNLVIPVVMDDYSLTIYYDKDQSQIFVLDSRKDIGANAFLANFIRFTLIPRLKNILNLKNVKTEIMFQSRQYDDYSGGYWAWINILYLTLNSNNEEEIKSYIETGLDIAHQIMLPELEQEFERICSSDSEIIKCLRERGNLKGKFFKEITSSSSLHSIIESLNDKGIQELDIANYNRFLAPDLYGNLKDKLTQSQIILFEVIAFGCISNVMYNMRTIDMFSVHGIDIVYREDFANHDLVFLYGFVKKLIEEKLNEDNNFLNNIAEAVPIDEDISTVDLRLDKLNYKAQFDYLKVVNTMLISLIVLSVIVCVTSFVITGQVDFLGMYIGGSVGVASVVGLGLFNLSKPSSDYPQATEFSPQNPQ